MIYLFNSKLELIDEIGEDQIILANETQELNKQIVAYTEFSYNIYNLETSYFGYKKQNNFYIYKIIGIKKQNKNICLEGIHLFFHELKTDIIRNIRPQDKTLSFISSTLLDNTGWEAVSEVGGTASISFYHISKLEAFYKLIELFNCEFELEIQFLDNKIKSKKVYFKNRISKDYGKWYEYGDKLLEVLAEEKYSDVFTAYIGMGKGEETEAGGYGRKIKFDTIEWKKSNGDPIDKPLNQDYVEIKEMTDKLSLTGKPLMRTVDFSEIEDRKKLLEETYKYALENSRPKVQLRARAIDTDKVELGETCAIIRPDLDIRYKTRIFKVQTNLINGIQSFEFGDKIYVSYTEKLSEEIKKANEKIEEANSLIVQALSNSVKEFFNKDGHPYVLEPGNKYGLPGGLYVFDKPIDKDPTGVVGIGGNGIVISNEKNVDGTWKVKTAIDNNGIVGEHILANSITANKLAADVGQSLDISSNQSISQTVEKLNNLNYKNINLESLMNKLNDENRKSFTRLQQSINEFKYEIQLADAENILYDTMFNSFINYSPITNIKENKKYFKKEGEIGGWIIDKNKTEYNTLIYTNNKLDAIAKNTITMQNVKIRQYFTVKKDIYSLSFKINSTDGCTIKIINITTDKTVFNQVFYSKTGYCTYEGIQLEEGIYYIDIITPEVGYTELGDLMLNRGEKVKTWQVAYGEVRNTNVNIGLDGVTVIDKNTGNKTIISPTEFAGYDRKGKKIFKLNNDITEVEKLKARSEVTMPPLRIVPITEGARQGWAFVTTTPEDKNILK